MKSSIILIFFFFLSGVTSLRAADSLSIKESLLEAWDLRYSDPDKSLEATLLLEAQSEKEKFTWGTSKASQIRAFHIFQNNDLPSSLHLANSSYIQFLALGDTYEAAQSLNIKGMVYKELQHSQDALLIYQKIIETINPNENVIFLGKCYNNLGATLDELENFEEAKENYEKALTIFLSEEFAVGISAVYNNMALLAKHQGKQNEAIDLFLNVLETAKTGDPNPNGTTLSLKNLGVLYRDTGKTEVAMYYFQKALANYIELENLSGIAEMEYTLAELFFEKNKITSAKNFANNAFMHASEAHFPLIQKQSIALLINLEKIEGNHEEIIELYETQNQINDSLMRLNEEQLALHYEVEIEIKQVERTYKELEHKEKLKDKLKTSIAVILFVCVIEIVFLFLLSSKLIQASDFIIKGIVASTFVNVFLATSLFLTFIVLPIQINDLPRVMLYTLVISLPFIGIYLKMGPQVLARLSTK